MKVTKRIEMTRPDERVGGCIIIGLDHEVHGESRKSVKLVKDCAVKYPSTRGFCAGVFQRAIGVGGSSWGRNKSLYPCSELVSE